MIRVLSLGGGVQSTVLAMRAGRGDFGPIPDAAVHADTQSDPPETMAMVEWLTETLPFPVHIVTGGSVIGDIATGTTRKSGGRQHTAIPVFLSFPDGGSSMGPRHCTSIYKIDPIRQFVRREMLGLAYRQVAPADAVEQWMGISWDESHRVRDSRAHWMTNRYPLVDAKITRQDCLDWWNINAPSDAPPLVRSSCICCPFHGPDEWLKLTDDQLAEVETAETSMQAVWANKRSTPWLHRRRIPIREALVKEAAIKDAQGEQGELWDMECEGMCGV